MPTPDKGPGVTLPATGNVPPPTSNFMADAMTKLNKVAGLDEPVIAEPKAKSAKAPPPAPEDKRPGNEPPPKLDAPPPEPARELQPETPKGKSSPWKLVDTYKAKAANLERELSEIKAKSGDPEVLQTASKRIETAEARAKELEEKIRYYDYQQSQEWIENHQKPWEAAWKAAASDLSELQITASDGTVRQATVQDLVALASLPLAEARTKANEWFGDAAQDMMMHRKTLRDLSKNQQEQLEKVKKEGSERMKAEQENQKLMQAEIVSSYTKFRDADISRFEWLQEKEGDDEWNQKLAKATRFVDDTIATSVTDPKLTPDARQQAIQKHAALRNRAIGFSLLREQNKRLSTKLKQLEAKLSEYQNTEPGGGDGSGREGRGAAAATGNWMQRTTSKLDAIAR